MVRLLFAFVLLPMLVLPQVRIVRVGDWEIPGIHHTRVEGRVVDAHGMAMAGAAVRLAAAPFTSIALYETRTGPHGDFEFPDVTCDGGLEGMVDPPAGWLPATFSIAEVNGFFQAGEIRLKPSAALRLVVETAPGKVYRGDPKELRVSVIPDESESRDAVTSYAGGLFTFDRLPCGLVKLEIEYKKTSYKALLTLDTGSRNRVFIARIPFGPDENRKLEIVEMVRPWEAPPAQTVEGTVRTPDGSPIDGAVAVVQSGVGRFGYGPVQSVITDAAGRYRADVPCGTTSTVQVAGDERPSPGTDLQSSHALLVEAVVEGPEPTAVAHARVRWRGPLGWRTLGHGQTWIAPFAAGAGTTVQFVAELPGYFPIFSRVEVPELPSAAPAPVVARFHFRRGPVRTLEVRAAGKPLEGAAIDIVRIGDPSELEPVPPVSYRTGSDGRLRLAGEVEGHYGVLVYARGYRLGRALWRAGAPLKIDLTPESAVLRIAGLARGQKARVWSDGGDQALAALVMERSPATVMVAPAKYRVLAFDGDGQVTGVAQANAIGGQTARVSLGANRGAEILVTVPDPDHVWDVTAVPALSGSPEDVVQAKTDGQVAVLRVRVGGRHRLHVTRENANLWLEREIEAPEGGTTAVSIPPLTATLTGFHPGSGTGNSGLLILETAAPDGWNVVLHPADLGQGQRDVVTGLPTGKYYAWTAALDPGTPHAWSGVPVMLEAGRTVEWNGSPPDAGSPLKIHVTGANGRSVTDALLYVNSVLVGDWDSGIPIFHGAGPMQQTLVPVRNGKAELPGAGPGRLLLELLSDRGRLYSLSADVGPGRTLEIRLPKEDQ